MNISVSLAKEYVPEFNGNRELPALEQIRISHKAPSLKIKENIFPKKYQYDASGEMHGSFELDRPGMLKNFIIAIKNLSWDDEGVSYSVKTVEELLKAPPAFEPLLDELYSYFQDLLNGSVNEKNSE